MPTSISVARDDTDASFTITLRWYRPVFAVLLAIAMAWDAIIAWMAHALMAGTMVDKHGQLIVGAAVAPNMALFAILLAIGWVATYLTLAGVMNRTTFHLHQGTLTISHGPLPGWGARELATRDIERLVCSERTTREKGGPQTWYSVAAKLSSGETKPLIKDLPDADQALFIEQEIKPRLNIVDVRVPADCGRRSTP
jgi:hypothetical protein